MSLTLTNNRPRLTPENVVTNSLTQGAVVETQISAQVNQWFIPYTITVTPTPFTVAGVTTTSASSIVTTTGGAFSNVKIGDVVSGTGITGGTTVIGVSSDFNSLTLSANATAAGTVTLTDTPPAVTATVMALQLILTENDTQQIPTANLLLYDGTLGSTAGNTSNYAQLINLLPSPPTNINVDTFLQNLRVVRT